MKKMETFVWFSCLLPELFSLNYQKLWLSCNFFADASKKSKAVTVIFFLYASESPRFAVLENDIGYYNMT